MAEEKKDNHRLGTRTSTEVYPLPLNLHVIDYTGRV